MLQTLESVQYRLEIIFKIKTDFNAGVCMTYHFQIFGLVDFDVAKYIYVIDQPGGPYWEKRCSRSRVLGPYSRQRAQFFPIRTNQGR